MHERDQKKIERVEGPTKEAGHERVPLIAIQHFKKPDRFHVLISYLSFPAEVEESLTISEIFRDVSTSVDMTEETLTSILSLRERKSRSGRCGLRLMKNPQPPKLC